MSFDKLIVIQMRVGCVNSVDLLHLSMAKSTSRVEAPVSLKSLAAKYFMKSSDATAESIRPIKEGSVIVGNLDTLAQQLPVVRLTLTPLEQIDRLASLNRPMPQ